MAGQRITSILLAKSHLTASDIDAMSDREAWSWLYQHFPPKTKKYKKNTAEVCFTGFSASERKELENEARDSHLDIVKSVTKNLRYLVAGINAGPAKLEKAKNQEVVILSLEQYRKMLETGELPTKTGTSASYCTARSRPLCDLRVDASFSI